MPYGDLTLNFFVSEATEARGEKGNS